MRKKIVMTAFGLLAACQQAPTPDANETALAKANAVTAQPIGNSAAPSPPVVKGRQSAFTVLDDTTCKLIEENKDEGPYWRRRCPGRGGYAVEWTESDLRQGLEVIDAQGEKTSLDLSGIVANGAFNHLGPRIEWRGNADGAPDALIVRLFVADGANPNAPDRSLLAVARLTRKPCLTAIVAAGPSQNEEARAKADAPGACLPA